MIKVTDFIVEHLSRRGIRDVFLVPGGGAMHLNDSFGRSSKIRYWCNHHEQACAIAAEGYYRASGRLAAVNVTSGPGGTNALTGVIGEWLDSIPCLYLSGQVKQETTIARCPDLRLRQLGDQEINIIDIVRPVTKYSVMLTDARTIRFHLDRALYLATHGRPGPVWLDIPLDIQGAQVDESELESYDSSEDEISCDVELIRKQVAELLLRLRSSERPVLFAGHGIRLAGGADLFLDLVSMLNIPVLTAICGHDLIWSDHPLFFGRPGVFGDRLGNFVLQNSDLMLAVGARLGVRQISYRFDAFARAAFRAMVDIDAAELRKPTLALHMGVHCDARFFIEEMLRQLRGDRMSPKRSWLSWCEDRRNSTPTALDDNPSQAEGYVCSYRFADELFKLLTPGTVVVTGNGTAFTCPPQVMKIKREVRYFSNQGCASMGYDLPAGIGAVIARPDDPVVVLTGDGSLQMNIQELQTIALHQLPLKVFVLNNQGYLAIRITQDTYFEGRHVGSDMQSGISVPDTCKIAEAYGLATARIASEECLPQRIWEVLSAPGPMICEVMMNPKQSLYPRLSSVLRPDGKMVSSPLEDMYPFLPREEFRDGMVIPPLDEG